MIEGTSQDWSQIVMQLAQARQQQQVANQRMQHTALLSKLLSSALAPDPMQIQRRPKKESGMMGMGGGKQQTRGSTGGVSMSDAVRSGGGGGFAGGGGGWGAMGL